MVKPNGMRTSLLMLALVAACAEDSVERDEGAGCLGDAGGCTNDAGGFTTRDAAGGGMSGTSGSPGGTGADAGGGGTGVDASVAADTGTGGGATVDAASRDGGSEAGAPPVGGGADASACGPAPTGVSEKAASALSVVNGYRVPVGSGCISMAAGLNMSSLNHCNYYAMNSANKTCIADVHSEVMSCMGFTGVNLGQRARAAGYTGQGASEVMAFVDDPTRAIASWVNSVWHRIPILDPWTGDMGYGNATRCDTIDFGRGTPKASNDTVVVYPYDGQTGLPTNFDGSREGPMPPAPASGWPSSSPITVYARGIKITEHVITRDGDATPMEHVFLDSASPLLDAGSRGFLTTSVFLYANQPFMPNTKYRVKVVGTRTGGTLNLEWTFTTGAVNRF
jgi:hypothetical protein